MGNLKVKIQLLRASDKEPTAESLGINQERRPNEINEIWVNEAISKIAGVLKSKGLNLDSAFNIIDINSNYSVSFEEFSSVVLTTLAVPLTQNEVQLVWRRIAGADISGQLTKHKFAETFGGYLETYPSQRQGMNYASRPPAFGTRPGERYSFGIEHSEIVNEEESKNKDHSFLPPNNPQKDSFQPQVESRPVSRRNTVKEKEKEPDQIFAEFTEILSKYMEDHKLSVTSLVLRMDQDRSNYVSKAEFRKFFLNKLQIKLEEATLDVVFDYADREKQDGRLSVSEFIKMLRLGSQIRFAIKRSGVSEELRSNVVFLFLVDYLKKQSVSFIDFFTGMDINKDGFIDLLELALFFKKIDVPIGIEEIEHFIGLLDLDKDHRLSRKEIQDKFERMLEEIQQKEKETRARMTPQEPQREEHMQSSVGMSSTGQERLSRSNTGVNMSQMSISDKVARMNGVFSKLAVALRTKNFSKKSLFSAIDRNHSGRIDKEELASAFKNMNVKLLDEELEFIFSSLDKDQSGYVDEKEFLSQLP